MTNQVRELMEQLYVECRLSLYERAMEETHDSYIAEDVVDDVFLYIIFHHRWWSRQSEEVRQKYADTVCQMMCRKYQQGEERGNDISYRDDVLFNDILNFTPQTKCIETEAVRHMLELLKVRDRDIFKKRYFECKPVWMIAEDSDMTENAVSQRLARGRKMLRSKIYEAN